MDRRFQKATLARMDITVSRKNPWTMSFANEMKSSVHVAQYHESWDGYWESFEWERLCGGSLLTRGEYGWTKAILEMVNSEF